MVKVVGLLIVGWIWGEDFQATPLNGLPPGWSILANLNADAWHGDTSCYWYLRQGSPGNPSGNMLLCTDYNHGLGINPVASEVVTPPIALPSGHNGNLTVTFDWTVQAGTLQAYVRVYNSGWNNWSLFFHIVDTSHTYGDTTYLWGSASQSLSIPLSAESLQIRFRYAHDPSDLYTRVVGGTVDNLEIQDSTGGSTGPCCHLDFSEIILDSVTYVGNTPFGHFSVGVCFTDTTCAPADTFEIVYHFNGIPQDSDTVFLSVQSCTTLSFSGALQSGVNTIEVVDNDCCTTPHPIFSGVDVKEARTRPRTPTIQVWVWAPGHTPPLPYPAKVYAPDGRVLKVHTSDAWRRLPPGRYRVEYGRGTHRGQALLLRLP